MPRGNARVLGMIRASNTKHKVNKFEFFGSDLSEV